MSGDRHRPALDAYFDGINSERYEDVAALFSADAVLRAPGFAPRRGRRQIADYLAGVLERFPEHHDQPTRFLTTEAAATVEIHFVGALRDGTPFEFDAVDIFDFAADGTFAGLTTWYDSNEVLGKLAKAAAARPPAGETAALGSVAEATPGRARAALRAVHTGRSLRISGAWREPRPRDAPPLLARAALLEVEDAERLDAERLEAAAAAVGVELRPGDALLVRTGRRRIAVDSVPSAVAALAVDAAVEAAPPGLLVGVGWDLSSALTALPAGGRAMALLVAGGAEEQVLVF